MRETLPREDALALLLKYNKDPFHIRHGLTVEAVMRWYANELGYGEDADFWANVGLLHDIDFELYPDRHCLEAPRLLKEGGADDALVHGVVCHAWGLHLDIKPEEEMEKVLYGADELTGLVWATAKMLPTRSAKGMELKSLKKKFKNKKFAAGCSREVIEKGAELLDWDLDRLLEMTMHAMADTEDYVNAETARLLPEEN